MKYTQLNYEISLYKELPSPVEERLYELLSAHLKGLKGDLEGIAARVSQLGDMVSGQGERLAKLENSISERSP